VKEEEEEEEEVVEELEKEEVVEEEQELEEEQEEEGELEEEEEEDTYTYTVAKTHRMPYILISHFPQKSPRIAALSEKITCNLRHPTGLRHPV